MPGPGPSTTVIVPVPPLVTYRNVPLSMNWWVNISPLRRPVARPGLEIVRDHPLRARIFRALGLFDVYGSWWFTLAYVLLLVSLAACLGPRTRALVRGLRRPPQPSRDLDGMRHYASGLVRGTPEEAVARASGVLRRRRFRVAAEDRSVAADKGGAREVGSLAFHWSFFLLLLGVVLGKGFGFTGQATIVEGDTWTEAHAGYDLPPRQGRFFAESMHRGFQVHVRDFEVTYREGGLPADFVSRVDVLEEGEVVGRKEIRVNDPLRHLGVKLYQSGFGWAPVIEVRHDGEPLASGPVVFVSDAPQDRRLPWRGVVKLPSLRPQVGIELQLLPDVAAFAEGLPMLEARSPFLTYTAWRGDLRLTSAQSVFDLDTEGMQRWEEGGVGLGETAELPGGLEISFPELREYTQLFVARDPGTGIVLAAAIVMLAGLIPALFSSRRRVWVRAEANGEGTRLEVAGFALQRKDAFDEEFRRLSAELVQ